MRKTERSCYPQTLRETREEREGERKNVGEEGETQRNSFKIAAGFSSAEIKAALYRLCSAVADSCF